MNITNDQILAALKWSLGRDTGVSSKQILLRAYGLPLSDAAWGYPKDGGDFGRCHRLLQICPHISIERMRGFNRIWDGLVNEWPSLTASYESQGERSREIYDRIHALEAPFKIGCSMKADAILYGAKP